MIRKVLISILGLLFSLQASADFISLDWKTDGDKLITVDTTTQLQWLDLAETRHMNVNDVSSELVDGGQLPGFRFATSIEVEQLLTHFGLIQPYDRVYRPDIYTASKDFFSYLGSFSNEPENYDVVVARASGESGITSGYAIASCHAGLLFFCPGDIENGPAPAYGTAYVATEEIDPEYRGYVYASWLVREESISVPEPSSLLLLISALLILVFSRRFRPQREI